MNLGLSASDLEDIRTSYEEELAGLTFNSKPIINMLTTIAQENMNAAGLLCKTIEDRIRSAPPHQKLPVMYLLDSISKNIGSPFTPIFGRNLYKTFMECYTAVDNNTRRALEALFATWKLPVTGSNSNFPVYSLEETRAIDEALLRIRALQGRNSQQYYSQPVPSRFSVASAYTSPAVYPGISPTTILLNVSPRRHLCGNILIAQDFNRDISPTVYRSPVTFRDPAVESLKTDIQGLLRTLTTRSQINPHDAPTHTFITSLTGLHETLRVQILQPSQLNEIRDQLHRVASFCAQPIMPTNPAPMSTPGPPMDLFAQLAKAGIIPPSGTSTPVANFPQTPPMVYIELSSVAMLQSRPELIDSLYSSMSLQCYQCGQRWRDTPEDRALKDEHLDWHFKTNKRIREHSVRTQSRALYLSETEWINFSISGDGEMEHKHEPVQISPDLGTKTVPKPSDPTLQTSVCPICKESFVTDWDDTSEDWVWKNAVNVGGKIYHAICHAEALTAQKKAGAGKASSSLKNEIKTEEVKDEVDDEDIALPSTNPDPVRQSHSPPTQVKTEEEVLPITDAKSFVLEDALKSLPGTLEALTGQKRKACDDGNDEERRIKAEPH